MIQDFNVFIIIPVHNRKEFTRNCLSSLRNQTYQDFKVIIIDDGSTDSTEEMIKNEFPEVHIIKGDGNLWWTKATNLGVKYAIENGADYIITLNNDTIATEDFLKKMIYWAEKTPNSLLGAFALDANTKEPIYGGEIINWITASSKKLLDTLNPKEFKELHLVSHYSGRGLLVPAKVFNDIGFYDSKNFPQAAADDDFTHRAGRAGYKIYCNYDAKLLIYPGESGDSKIRKSKNVKNYYNHLFDKKGGGNLKYFIKYAVRNCPSRYLIFFLSIGLFRRIFGYLFEWAKESLHINN